MHKQHPLASFQSHRIVTGVAYTSYMIVYNLPHDISDASHYRFCSAVCFRLCRLHGLFFGTTKCLFKIWLPLISYQMPLSFVGWFVFFFFNPKYCLVRCAWMKCCWENAYFKFLKMESVPTFMYSSFSIRLFGFFFTRNVSLCANVRNHISHWITNINKCKLYNEAIIIMQHVHLELLVFGCVLT